MGRTGIWVTGITSGVAFVVACTVMVASSGLTFRAVAADGSLDPPPTIATAEGTLTRVELSYCMAGETHCLPESHVFLFSDFIYLNFYVGKYVRVWGWLAPSPECTLINVTDIEIVPAVHLTLAKSVDDDTPAPGQQITYTIAVENSGSADGTNAVISDTLPTGLTFVGPVRLEGTTGTVAEDADDLPTLASSLTILAGQHITVTFPVMINTVLKPGTRIINTAAITSSEVFAPQMDSQTIVINYKYRVYLPLAVRDGPNQPDR